MKKLGLNEIREKYLNFFESKGHLVQQSYPLVPQNDNSLLLINAGMAPLKPYFTGMETPPRNRMATCQKCIRTGDIENVGKTHRHGTFFEMLGNFSFGDYFKEEVIPWAWEFCTEVLELPKERLYVSVYHEDDEAFDFWTQKVGVAEDHMIRLGKKDNFWEIGVGPCGPCSEIYFDRGEKYGTDEANTLGGDGDRFMEFWNLVFTQFDKDEEGVYHRLSKPNIDTGMGLERMALIMQEVDSIYDVDTIKSIRDHVCKAAKVEYNSDANKDVSIRVITDHLRATTFMIADGVLPSNEGRGYVLRRLLRRAARHGKLLGIEGAFLYQAALTVIEASKGAYAELSEKQEYIQKIIKVEEERFQETVDTGLSILNQYVEELKTQGKKVLSGDKVFKLHDTYGFPLDLTKEILEEEGFEVDEAGFKKEMENQRTRAREAREESTYMGADTEVFAKLSTDITTEFKGYETLVVEDAKVAALVVQNDIITSVNAGDEVTVILDTTPFYAESGGQVGDTGKIIGSNGIIRVQDCKKAIGNRFLHVGVVEHGTIEVGEIVRAEVDEDRRAQIGRNHSATHLLHKALKEVLGSHVNQAGSYVGAEGLRFDFNHFQGMTADEIEEVERKVNAEILCSSVIAMEEMDIEAARQKGATALFGEKYGDVVRVVSMGEYSIELCGGTHVNNTAQLGVFKIVSESGVAAGVRRIEAVTGTGFLELYEKQQQTLSEISKLVRSNPNQVINAIERLTKEHKESQKVIEQLKAQLAKGAVEEILSKVVEIKGVKILVASLENMGMEDLRNTGDSLKNKLGSGVVTLASVNDGKVQFVAMATEDAVKKGVHAGNIIKAAAAVAGGGGGGRPNMAQAGGKDASKLQEALDKALEVITEQIRG